MQSAPWVAVLTMPDAGVPRRAAGVVARDFHQPVAASREVIEPRLMGSGVKPVPALPVSDDHGASSLFKLSRSSSKSCTRGELAVTVSCFTGALNRYRRPPDPEGAELRAIGQRTAHLRDARAVQIEALVVGAGILVVGADDVAPAPFVPSVPAMSCCSRVLPSLRQTTARLGQLSVLTQASIVIRSTSSIAGLSSTTRRGPLSKRMQLPPRRVLSSPRRSVP